MAIRQWKNWTEVPEITTANIRALDDSDRKILRIVAAILEQNTGVDTPFENFVYEMLTICSYKPMTPQVMEALVNDYQRHFDWMTESVEKFMNDFPEQFEALRRKQVEASKRRERPDASRRPDTPDEAIAPPQDTPSLPPPLLNLKPPIRRTGERMEAR